MRVRAVPAKNLHLLPSLCFDLASTFPCSASARISTMVQNVPILECMLRQNNGEANSALCVSPALLPLRHGLASFDKAVHSTETKISQYILLSTYQYHKTLAKQHNELRTTPLVSRKHSARKTALGSG